MTVILKSPGETNESALKRKKGKSLEHGEKELSILCQGTLKKKKKKTCTRQLHVFRVHKYLLPSYTIFSSTRCSSMSAMVVYRFSDYGLGYVEHVMDIKNVWICT